MHYPNLSLLRHQSLIQMAIVKIVDELAKKTNTDPDDWTYKLNPKGMGKDEKSAKCSIFRTTDKGKFTSIFTVEWDNKDSKTILKNDDDKKIKEKDFESFINSMAKNLGYEEEGLEKVNGSDKCSQLLEQITKLDNNLNAKLDDISEYLKNDELSSEIKDKLRNSEKKMLEIKETTEEIKSKVLDYNLIDDEFFNKTMDTLNELNATFDDPESSEKKKRETKPLLDAKANS